MSFPLTKTAVVRHERARDRERIEALLDQAFGPDRHGKKTVYRLRDGVEPVRELSYVVEYVAGGEEVSELQSFTVSKEKNPETQKLRNSETPELAATIRYWPVLLPSNACCLLLGPIAVDEARKNEGIGASLMSFSMNQARALGYESLLLVGDAPYYARFGFNRAAAKTIQLPGPVEEARFLGLEWVPGALSNEQGLLRKWPHGRLLPHYKKS